MKKLISTVLAAAFAAVAALSAVPTAFAAETAESVSAVIQKSALINNAEDYEIYSGSTMPSSSMEDFKKTFSAEQAYPLYEIPSGSVWGEDTIVEPFKGEDAKTAKISDSLTCENYLGGHRYVYKSTKEANMMGLLNLSKEASDNMGFSSYMMSMHGAKLFFSPDSIAEIINANGIGTPEDIRYVEFNYTDYIGSPIDSTMVYIRTEKDEYMITDVEYTDGKLSHYLVLDREAFIECMQGKPEKALEKAYDNLKVQKAPVFTDLSDDKAVSLLVRCGIVNGYEDGSFGGDRSITRAEAAKMLALTVMDGTTNFDYAGDDEAYFVFTDVDENHWARNYIAYGHFAGYISGVEKSGKKTIQIQDGFKMDESGVSKPVFEESEIDTYVFKPEDTVTEQQLVKMLVSAADKFGDTMALAEGGYPDGYVAVAKRMGICESASEKSATRLTAAHMIKNALDAEVTRNTDVDVLHTEDNDGNFVGTEMSYEKGIFYSCRWPARSVKLSGKITASHATDDSLREKEVKFTVGKDAKSLMGEYKSGDVLTLLTGYDDIASYTGNDCDVYVERVDGNLVAIMAE